MLTIKIFQHVKDQFVDVLCLSFLIVRYKCCPFSYVCNENINTILQMIEINPTLDEDGW